MPFVAELGLGLGSPYHDDDAGAFVIDFQLGYESDPAQGIAQSILMSVILFQDDQSPAVELCFGIRRENIFPPHAVTHVEETDYDSGTARRYVPEVSRAPVTNLIMQAIGDLCGTRRRPARNNHEDLSRQLASQGDGKILPSGQ